MKDYPYLYRGSLAEARRRNQISLWRESLQENIRCKNAIEEAIRMNFDGMHMRFDCIEPMIRDFGFLRIAWVLSNTLQQKEWDGRFRRRTRNGQKRCLFPKRAAEQIIWWKAIRQYWMALFQNIERFFKDPACLVWSNAKQTPLLHKIVKQRYWSFHLISCAVAVGAVETSCGWHWRIGKTMRCGASAYGMMRSRAGTGPN